MKTYYPPSPSFLERKGRKHNKINVMYAMHAGSVSPPLGRKFYLILILI